MKPRIAFWRYRNPSSGYAGFHITANEAGCQALLERLRRRPFKSFRVNLTAPSAEVLTVPNSSSDAVSFADLTIRVEETELSVRVEEHHPHSTMTISEEGLNEFLEGIQAIAEGRGDYAIGSAGHEIWFWWWPGDV